MLDSLVTFIKEFPGFFQKVYDALRLLFTAWLVRKTTITKTERDAYKQENEVLREQAEIAARPPSRPSSVRDRMRKGDL